MRVEVLFRSTTSDGGFNRYLTRDQVALLTKGDIVYLDDTPWAVGYYEIKQRTIKFNPTAEVIETVVLLMEWKGYYG